MSSNFASEFTESGDPAGPIPDLARDPSSTDEDKSSEPWWLVMLYLAGDNNLTEDMVVALQDLIEAGPLGQDRIVAQLDPSARGLATQTYDFSDFTNPDGTPKKKLEEFLVNRAPDTNSGSAATLSDFIRWAVKRHGNPNVRYLLILSGHGSGITEDFFLRDAGSMDSLSVPELAEALSDIQPLLQETNNHEPKKIDILGMDACYMAMGEVAYQIRGSVDIMVGAEGLEPEFGWPYRQILAAAKAQYQKTGHSMHPEELATLIVNEYIDHYSEYDRAAGRSADLAAIRLTERNGTSGSAYQPGIEGVAEGLKRLASSLQGAEQKKILLAHWYAQTYKFDQFVDLKDFCDQLQQQFPQDSEIWACSADLMTAIKDCIIRSGCSGFACQYSYGFSIYFPWSYVSPDYAEVEMAKYTHWNCFLQKHITATRRPSRYVHDPLFPVVAEGVDPAQAAKQRQDAMNKVLDQNAPTDPAVKRIFDRVTRLRHCPPLPGENDEDNIDRINAVASGIVASDLPSVDVAREFTRRFLRRSGVGPAGTRYTENTRSSRYSEHSRYAERSRYSEHSRYVEDRETWVKNLPPEVGKVFFP